MKYVLFSLLILFGFLVILEGLTKKITKINNDFKLNFIDSSWIGQGSSRYYSYNYNTVINGKSSIVISRKKINNSFYFMEIKKNLYLKEKYKFDHVYYAINSPFIWRMPRIIFGIISVIFSFVVLKEPYSR